MRYVFISHASDDKPLLREHIRRLLAELDDDIGLWIDTPELIDPELAPPRVVGIDPGGGWGPPLDRALTNCVCVVAFWSTAAVSRERQVFLREVDTGRVQHKCVQLKLTALEHNDIPAPYSFDQILDVSDLRRPECDKMFSRAIRQVNAFARGGSVEVSFNDLPYLADRQPQMRDICDLVAEQMIGEDRIGEPALAVASTLAKPLLFILPCREWDVADKFIWRLHSKDGPERCGTRSDHDLPGWVYLRLEWPSVGTPATFQAEFKRNLPTIKSAWERARARQRPLCCYTLIFHEYIQKDVRRAIEAWIGFWNALPGQLPAPAGKSAETQPPIVAILSVIFGNAERRFWRFWTTEREPDDQVLDSFNQAEVLRSLDVANVALRALARLRPVNKQEAQEWLASHDIVQQRVDIEGARMAIQKAFGGGRDKGIPMLTFAEAILQSLTPSGRTQRS
jgi:hypothetical protein